LDYKPRSLVVNAHVFFDSKLPTLTDKNRGMKRNTRPAARRFGVVFWLIHEAIIERGKKRVKSISKMGGHLAGAGFPALRKRGGSGYCHIGKVKVEVRESVSPDRRGKSQTQNDHLVQVLCAFGAFLRPLIRGVWRVSQNLLASSPTFLTGCNPLGQLTAHGVSSR
jgi:hypothetical protein